MKITKLEHACLVIDEGGKLLIIDPGSFTAPQFDGEVVGVVITHEHPDHWTPEHLTRILDKNPGAVVYGPQGVANAAEGFEVEIVNAGDTREVGPFALQWFGGQHAIIHSSIPVIDNLGVLVDETLFHPGDSFTIPDGIEVDTLAVPSSAPWLKIGEVMDYVAAVAPKRAFPIHEMINSQAGKQMANGRIAAVVEQGGGEFFPLEPGESISV